MSSLDHLKNVINFDINMSEIKDSFYLSLDQLNQVQCILFLFTLITCQSTITREQIKTSR